MAFKKFLIVLISLFTIALYAQNKEQDSSLIRISEKDLTSVIIKIVEAKKQKMDEQTNAKREVKENTSNVDSFEIDYLNKKIKSLQKQLKSNNSQKTYSTASSPNNNSNLRQDIEYLEFKINELQKLQAKQNSNNPISIIIEQDTLNNENLSKKDSLNTIYNQKQQNSIDSLSIELNNQISKTQTSSPDYAENLSNIEKELIALQKELNLKKTTASNYNVLLKKYSGYKKQIHFKNNSKTIDQKENEGLKQTVRILKENENIDVLVKGFASKKGTPVYNQNLSMQRTESIKLYLITKGIHPTRILTIYHGIDYEATTEDEARRVDISFIIRK